MSALLQCPCLSGKPYARCCEPFLAGVSVPKTAEQLMRSRYTAFATSTLHYLELTDHQDFRAQRAQGYTPQTGVKWRSLKIINTHLGREGDEAGEVEFEAAYELQGRVHVIREKSRFSKVAGRWYYLDGRSPTGSPVSSKIGRNDPCPCGSGVKYKKCCG
ncbi:MAG: YchJ family metal-binding protein [Gammaproteobacteria bacterium]|nr:YchJ family metal-binding protein [Gammaproteobacteria bacterium]